MKTFLVDPYTQGIIVERFGAAGKIIIHGIARQHGGGGMGNASLLLTGSVISQSNTSAGVMALMVTMKSYFCSLASTAYTSFCSRFGRLCRFTCETRNKDSSNARKEECFSILIVLVQVGNKRAYINTLQTVFRLSPKWFSRCMAPADRLVQQNHPVRSAGKGSFTAVCTAFPYRDQQAAIRLRIGQQVERFHYIHSFSKLTFLL